MVLTSTRHHEDLSIYATCRLRDIVDGHPFNHQLDLLLPTQPGEGSRQLSAGLPAENAFGSARTNLSTFLDLAVLRDVISQQSVGFRCLVPSLGQDYRGAAAISPEGELHLRLSAHAYQGFGLTGRRSKQEKGQLKIPFTLEDTRDSEGQASSKQTLECCRCVLVEH